MRSNSPNRPLVLPASGLFAILLGLLALTAPAQAPAKEAESRRVLTTAAEVRALTPEEADQGIPIRLRGCFMTRELSSFAMIDETDGIFLFTEADFVIDFQPKDLVEVEGVTLAGDYAPCGVAHSVRRIGYTDMPEPRPATIAELHTGQLDAAWVEVTGIVRSIEHLPDTVPEDPYAAADPSLVTEPHDYTLLKLADGHSEVAVELQEVLDPKKYLDAKIRLRGINFYLQNDNRQAVRPILHSTNGIVPEIIQPPLTTDFSGPPRPVSSLITFDPTGGHPGHRVHVRGVVTHHRPGQALWIRDETHSLQIHTTQADHLVPGDIVDALGFPEMGTYSPVLQDAVFRRSDSQSSPDPVRLDDIEMITQHDSNLVLVEARLVEVQRYPESVELTLQGLGTTISASLPTGSETTDLPNWEAGSTVSVSGIASVGVEDTIPRNGRWTPQSLHILLRSPGDLAVIVPAPWWTSKRISYALALVLTLAVITIAIVVLLSRRRIHEQKQQRSMAESEFSAILNERNRVAREIHDTLAQSIGAISVQLELVRTDASNLSDGTLKHVKTAHMLARNALTDARDSIWNMRSQVLEKHDLGEALKRIVKQLTDGTEIVASAQVEGQRRRLPPIVENNLLRIGQEAVTNACKHANPHRIDVTITYHKRRVELEVSDDGNGFDPDAVSRDENRSFGLVGMRERIELIGGNIEFRSAIGKGTRIWVEAND
ncbi:sensor histidine kinase [Pelagicoccus sp. SDUM812003]|uniref:sensor histidine kinase n=1 Tax=Pelagicoccus sp. SDUM812003 TaxID=3041267 RepID=UPI00280EA0D9|nr:sensor histidine kinase [Pelagicoccus sp. SDUM812003]MDQ8205448.1 sensor histidine kinase [Pelagicoccus sp. SDUM812003]